MMTSLDELIVLLEELSSFGAAPLEDSVPPAPRWGLQQKNSRVEITAPLKQNKGVNVCTITPTGIRWQGSKRGQAAIPLLPPSHLSKKYFQVLLSRLGRDKNLPCEAILSPWVLQSMFQNLDWVDLAFFKEWVIRSIHDLDARAYAQTQLAWATANDMRIKA